MLYICVVPLNTTDKDYQVFSYPFHKLRVFLESKVQPKSVLKWVVFYIYIYIYSIDNNTLLLLLTCCYHRHIYTNYIAQHFSAFSWTVMISFFKGKLQIFLRLCESR